MDIEVSVLYLIPEGLSEVYEPLCNSWIIFLFIYISSGIDQLEI